MKIFPFLTAEMSAYFVPRQHVVGPFPDLDNNVLGTIDESNTLMSGAHRPQLQVLASLSWRTYHQSICAEQPTQCPMRSRDVALARLPQHVRYVTSAQP